MVLTLFMTLCVALSAAGLVFGLPAVRPAWHRYRTLEGEWQRAGDELVHETLARRWIHRGLEGEDLVEALCRDARCTPDEARAALLRVSIPASR